MTSGALRRTSKKCMDADAGETRYVELHWYEAHGIGRKDMKIKYYLK